MLRRDVDEGPGAFALDDSYNDGQNDPLAASARGAGLETAAKFPEERCAL